MKVKINEFCAEIDDAKVYKTTEIKRVGKPKLGKVSKGNDSGSKGNDNSIEPDGKNDKIRPIKVSFSNNWDKRIFLSKTKVGEGYYSSDLNF